MTGLSLLAFILAAVPAASTEDAKTGATELFREDFEQESDQDFDKLPDRWSRVHGPGFPLYLSAEVSSQEPAEGASCLEVVMDGGAVALRSAQIPVVPGLDYIVDCSIKTDGLVRDKAFLTLRALDELGKTVESHVSTKIGGTQGWTRVRLGPLTLSSREIRTIQISLHVESPERPDMQGRVSFDNIRATRVPRVWLDVEPLDTLYQPGDQISVRCHAVGIGDAGSQVRFALKTVEGAEAAAFVAPLAPISPGSSEAVAAWKLKLDAVGYFMLSAQVGDPKGTALEPSRAVAVIAAADRPETGEFGWALSNGEGSHSLEILNRLAPKAGIHWLKFPLWLGEEESDTKRIDELLAFFDRLEAEGISVVGTLHQPPRRTLARMRLQGESSAARLFSTDWDAWFGPLESAMARLTIKVAAWQLGAENDASLGELPDFETRLADVRAILQRVDQTLNLSVACGWPEKFPENEPLVVDSFSLYVRNSRTPEEIAAYLSKPRTSQAEWWLTLEAPDATLPTLNARAADLVHRMLAAKRYGADRVYFDDPLAGSGGLLHDDGAPGDLLLPWSITSRLLAGASYAGMLDLPGGSPNAVFRRDKSAVMIIWNSQPKQESAYLGGDVSQIDLWGRPLPLSREGDNIVIQSGPMPSFVVGLNEALVQWRTSFAFRTVQMPSVYGSPLPNGIHAVNSFDHHVQVKVRLSGPTTWKFSRQEFDFQMAPGETIDLPFEIILPIGASHGAQPIQVAFDIQGEDEFHFSIERMLEVGEGSLEMKISSRLDEAGNLVVEQRLKNHGDAPIVFRCHLSAPSRRRLRRTVKVAAQGEIVATYRLPHGSDLIGRRLSLRAEEIGGSQMLNEEFFARETP